MPSLIIGFDINCEQYLTVFFFCKAETVCNTCSKEDLSRQVGDAFCVQKIGHKNVFFRFRKCFKT